MFFEAQDHTLDFKAFYDVQAFMDQLVPNFGICTT